MHTLFSHQDLEERLGAVGWQSRLHEYSALFVHATTAAPDLRPQVSVVVIAHAPTQHSLEAFMLLKAQAGDDTEIIFVDNGSESKWGKLLSASATTFVRLHSNAGAYLARNMGCVFARGNLLIFVDDDAVPTSNLLQAHRAVFAKYHPLCVRGRVEPLTEALPNGLARHYDLGNKVIPRYPDLEGNLAVDAQAFFQVGGWDDNLVYGHGGMDLSVRLLQLDGDRGRQLYSPAPLIRHDYAADTRSLQAKREKQHKAWVYLCSKHTSFDRYVIEWENWYMRGGQPTVSLPPVTPTKAPAVQEVSETFKASIVHDGLIPRKKTIYLHIGLPKTGTTAIQSTLENMTEALAEQDYAYVTCGQCFHWLLMLLDAWERGEKPDDAVATMMRDHIEAIPQNRIILSCENFSGYFFYEQRLLTRDIADVLSTALHGYAVQVLIYLRRQDCFFESIYTQTLHIGRDWSFEEYAAQSTPEILRWKTILDAYTDAFGKESLTVRIYERARLHNNDAVSNFIQWVGIHFSSQEQESPPQVNLSLSPKAARIARAFNAVISLTEEERATLPHTLEAAKAEDAKQNLEYLHCRQACRHGIHPARFHSMHMNRLQSLLNHAGAGQHASQVGYMEPAQRAAFMEDFATENAAIAREYLGKEDGLLFDDTLPQTTVCIDDPSPKDIVDVLLPVLLHMDARQDQMEMRTTASETNIATLMQNMATVNSLEERIDVLAHMVQWLVSQSRTQNSQIATLQENLVEATELIHKLVDVIVTK